MLPGRPPLPPSGASTSAAGAVVASEATRAAKLQEIQERRFARALHVPTDDGDVRAALRDRRAAPTQEGEDAHGRRERLRGLMAREALDAGASAPPTAAPASAHAAAGKAIAEPPNEEYWTKGTAALRDARMRVARASLAAAARRLGKERALRGEETGGPLRAAHAAGEAEAMRCGRGLTLRLSERAEGRPLSAAALCSGVLATGCWGGMVAFWDVATCRRLYSVQAHEARVSMVEMPAAGVALSAGADGQACLLRGGDSCDSAVEVAHRYTGHTSRVSAARMHPHVGDIVATVGHDATLRLHSDTATLALHNTGHRAATWAAWHADGSLLATTGSEGGMRLWDVRSGRAVLTMERLHADQALRCAFSGDGRLIASGGADNVVVVTDLRKQRAVKKIAAHSKVVSSLQFAGGDNSSDVLLSASFDGTVKLWAVRRDLALVNALTAHEDKVVAMAADNNLGTIVTACYDRTWKVWQP